MRWNKFLFLTTLVLMATGLVNAQAPQALELYRQGIQRMEEENLFEAIVHFKDALALNPKYLDPMLELAEAYYYLDEYDEALRYVTMASPLGRDNARLLNIHGRILLALGKSDEAAAIFRSIQKREPYNIDALLGLAEFSLAKGDELSALKQYQKSLEYSSKNRRILLSLSLMYENKGDRKLAESFLLKALDSFPENALVQTLASEYYLRLRQYKDAEFHAGTALTLVPQHKRALESLSRIYFAMGDYERCLTIIAQIHQNDTRHARAWYLRAQALISLGRIDEAVRSLESALTHDPSDEISRLVLENLLLGKYEEDSELRTRHGAWHFTQANEYRKKNMYSRAEFHYKRGLLISPFNVTGRRAYAEFLKTLGRNARFLQQLVLLRDQGVNDTFVNDNHEIYTSLLSESVSSQWRTDQFNVDRNPLYFRVFYQAARQNLEHPAASQFLAEYTQQLLGTSYKINFGASVDEEFSADVIPRLVNGESDAFRTAREERVDYYILVSFAESGDDFQASVDLYLGRTGTKIRSYQAYRTGNFRVQTAIFQIVESIQREIPLRGKLLARKVNEGLINIGAADGIKVGDKLHLVDPKAYVLQGEAPGFVYNTENEVGTLTVSKVDELIAVGTIQRSGFFDKINLGDTILRDGESVVKPKDATANFPYLYNQIRGIR